MMRGPKDNWHKIIVGVLVPTMLASIAWSVNWVSGELLRTAEKTNTNSIAIAKQAVANEQILERVKRIEEQTDAIYELMLEKQGRKK